MRKEATHIWEEIGKMREETARIWEEIASLRREMAWLREDFNRMQKTIDARLTRVERTLEKLTVDIEEEARSIVANRLRQMGYEVELTSLRLPEFELNLYGAADDLCVIGECRVRATPRLLEELKRKYEFLRKARPNLLRPRVLLVIYASLAPPELVEA